MINPMKISKNILESLIGSSRTYFFKFCIFSKIIEILKKKCLKFKNYAKISIKKFTNAGSKVLI